MKLEVNKEKTKITVFRKCGFLARHEKWFYDDIRLDVVNKYCYSGFNFTTKMSCKQGTDHLVAKGKKSGYISQQSFSEIQGNDIRNIFQNIRFQSAISLTIFF